MRALKSFIALFMLGLASLTGCGEADTVSDNELSPSEQPEAGRQSIVARLEASDSPTDEYDICHDLREGDPWHTSSTACCDNRARTRSYWIGHSGAPSEWWDGSCYDWGILHAATRATAAPPLVETYSVTWEQRYVQTYSNLVPADASIGRNFSSGEDREVASHSGTATVKVLGGVSRVEKLSTKALYSSDYLREWARYPGWSCITGWGLSGSSSSHAETRNPDKYAQDPAPPQFLHLAPTRGPGGSYTMPYPLEWDPRTWEVDDVYHSTTQICSGGSNSDSQATSFSIFADTRFRGSRVPPGVLGDLTGDSTGSRYTRTASVTKTAHDTVFSTRTETHSVTILVERVSAPVAEFSFAPTGPTIAQALTYRFDGSASRDPAGSAITEYAWKFGDGTEIQSPVPVIEHTFPARGKYLVTLTVRNANGTPSEPVTHEVTVDPCRESGPVPVTLPAVNISYDYMYKPVRVKYGELPLQFAPTSPASGSLCAMSATGTLPVTIGLIARKLVDGIYISVDSNATATLDFLPPGTNVPDCAWDTTSHECSVGGSGDILVRWHTEGFREILNGVQVYDSGPLTYYARVPSSATFAEAVQQVEPLLHVELSTHLGKISKLYIVQEPPADVLMRDAQGRTTGVAGPGASPVEGIPHSVYVTDHQGYSAVVLFAPEPTAYTAFATGAPGSQFTLSMTKIDPARPQAAEYLASGTIGASGRAGVCFDPEGSCQGQYVYDGVRPPMNADGSSDFALGRTVPVKIRVNDTVGAPASGVQARLALAPITGGVAGNYRPAASRGNANQADEFRALGAGEYGYNLDTSVLAIGRWSLRITLDDGSVFYEEMTLR